MSEARPRFFIVGAMKAGTSSLRAALLSHPRVAMPPREIHFFSQDVLHEQGLDWYHAHFDGLDASALVGEKSADYIASKAAPERLARYAPDARLIVTLRDPVRRAVSQYHHSQRRANGEATSVEEEIARGLYLGDDDYPRSYVHRSQYDKHLARFDAFFAPEQMLVLVFEETVRDPEPALARVQRFLGLEPQPGLTLPHGNATRPQLKQDYSVAEETLARLRELLAPTVDAVEARLGRPLPDWRGPGA